MIENLISNDNISSYVLPVGSEIGGFQYKFWTVKFWQWLLSISADRNPITDQTGIHCSEGQDPNSPVFFLAFSKSGNATRKCTISAGKAILVPVNVVECSTVEFFAENEAGLRELAKEDESSNPLAFLSVNGVEVKDVLSYRVDSDLFELNLPENSVLIDYGFTNAKNTTATAVSDGYWIILKELPVGTYGVYFEAQLSKKNGDIIYSDKLTYDITISPTSCMEST